MRLARRRVLPIVIGVSLATTIVADLVAADAQSGLGRQAARAEGYVAAAQTSGFTPAARIAPLNREITPHILVASPATLPAGAVAQVQALKGVKAVEPVDAARAYVGGKRVGVMGVEPSTFRAYTPEPSAKSDGLWRNIAAGDVAISFTMGKDGGVPLGSWTQIGSASRHSAIRVGAYATMGISQVDAVVSHATAQAIGMPTGNAMLISAPKADLGKLRKTLTKVLPKGTRTAELESRFNGAPAPGHVPAGKGNVMTAEQVVTAIKAAESKLNMPYVWGGESDAEGGYDCSGLVQYAFGKAGIPMPRTADIQAFTGWRLPYSKAVPGDLLTWKNDPTFNGVSHIAIYLGDNKMVVAPHTGAFVRIQDVYMTNFWGAIRVNPHLAAKMAGVA